MRFACKKIKLKDIFKCSFNLNKTEYNVFYVLIKSKKPLKVSSVAEQCNLSKSSVQKALKLLQTKKLVALPDSS